MISPFEMPRKKKPTRVANNIDGLFERLTSLLGEQPNSAVVTDFLNDTGIDLTDKDSIDIFMDLYYLPEIGVVLKTWKGVVASISIRLFNWEPELESFQMYSGDYGHGINASDDRETVKKKLGIEPSTSDETPKTKHHQGRASDRYKLPEYRLSIIFSGETNAISLVTVSSYQFGSLTDEDIDAYKKENPD